MSGQSPEAQPELDAPRGARFAIVAARFNANIVDRLLEGATAELKARGVAAGDLVTVRVPGAFELPLACKRIAEKGDVHAVIALVREEDRAINPGLPGKLERIGFVRWRDFGTLWLYVGPRAAAERYARKS